MLQLFYVKNRVQKSMEQKNDLLMREGNTDYFETRPRKIRYLKLGN